MDQSTPIIMTVHMLQCLRYGAIATKQCYNAGDTVFLSIQDSVTMHTIDELAHISGVPSRTIRFYNTQGMLPPPTMRGRVAYYAEEHLLVLNIIKELRE